MGGFEPTDNRVKVCCLTTWRHPIFDKFSIIVSIKIKKDESIDGQGGIRTPDTVVRSHVL